jgi:hypothetical protein
LLIMAWSGRRPRSAASRIRWPAWVTSEAPLFTVLKMSPANSSAVCCPVSPL